MYNKLYVDSGIGVVDYNAKHNVLAILRHLQRLSEARLVNASSARLLKLTIEPKFRQWLHSREYPYPAILALFPLQGTYRAVGIPVANHLSIALSRKII